MVRPDLLPRREKQILPKSCLGELRCLQPGSIKSAQLKESLASIGRLSVLLGTVSAKGLGASIPTILELAQEITEKAREVAQLVEMKERTS
jgi:hypothetical protein